MHGDSFIRHVIDMIGVFIQAEQLLFQSIIPEFGASLGWKLVMGRPCKVRLVAEGSSCMLWGGCP